jgi:transposase
MTETTRIEECSAAGSTLYLAFELGSTKWTLAFTTSRAQRPRLRTIAAGELGAVTKEIAQARERLGVAATARVRSCYEAGRDGFWLDRWLATHGIDNVVVDSSSIEVNRRARRAKTDRLDAGSLLHLLMRWAQGERKVWSVVRVPTPEAEAARQVIREIETVRQERQRVRNRLLALLATQGIRCALTRRFAAQVATLQTGDGRPLPALWQARLTREWRQLQATTARLRELRVARLDALAAGDARVAQVTRQLCRLRGVAETGATICSAELFGTRAFTNGRQIGALLGLAPVPYRSDQRVQDQGISKAGRRQLRRVSIQLAWCWLRYQPDSALTRWFQQRFGAAGGRSRRIGIVAVARKLMIALWRFAAHGVIPEGATLKAA